MAQLIIDGKKYPIADGEEIKGACKTAGVHFFCESGLCRTCEITVEEGEDNLQPRTDSEQIAGMKGKQRLACQCRIERGTVKIKY